MMKERQEKKKKSKQEARKEKKQEMKCWPSVCGSSFLNDVIVQLL
jgi:hypothetical protein